MRRRVIKAWPWVFVFLLLPSLGAQQATQSLADLARKERERKKEQPQAKKVFTNDDVSGKEVNQDSPHNVLAGVKSAAEGNPSSAGSSPTNATSAGGAKGEPESAKKADDSKKKIPSLELSDDERRALRILFDLAVEEEVCWKEIHYYIALEQMLQNGCGNHWVRFRKGYDPRDDAEYQYSLDIVGDTCQIHADPRRSGDAGFFTDGDEIYYNPKGAASKNDQALTVRQINELMDKGTTTR
jgi:hypothetical protein